MMSDKKMYYFVRHGETDYNSRRIVQGSGIDSDLNKNGLLQSQKLYEYYKNISFEIVIASCLKRSGQTVAPFINSFAPIYERTDLINEICWGVHEGQAGNQQMKDNYQKMVDQWAIGNFDAALEGAESARQLAQRCLRFLSALVLRVENTVLICTHGRTLRCLVCLMKGQHLRHMEDVTHDNTGVFQVTYESDKGFTFLMENDTSHLIG